MWYVYLLYSPTLQQHYVGSTNDLAKRIKEHNSRRSRFTSKASDWQLKNYHEFSSEVEARERERAIKKNKKYRLEFYKSATHALPV